MLMERDERSKVVGHGVICEIAANHLTEPTTLFRDREVHLASQRTFDLSQLRSHAITSGFPLDEELPLACLSAMKVKPRKSKVSGFSQTRSLASVRRKTAERDQSGLVRVQRKRELPQPRFHRLQEAPRIGFVLEAERPHHRRIAR